MRSAASWAVLLFATGLDYLTTTARLVGGHGEVKPVIAGVSDVVGLNMALVVTKPPAVALVGLFWLVLLRRYRDIGVGALAAVWVAGALWDAIIVAEIVV